MHFQNVRFVTSWFGSDKLNIPSLPEIVFVGKSNVGKSSLINKLINRKNLARTSQNPGKTISVNYYEIDNEVYFVDLPGYGYAKRSFEQIDSWKNLTDNYFDLNTNIRLFVFLIDIRHDPTDNDLLMYEYLRKKGHDYIIVATKSDKLNSTQLTQNTEKLNSYFEKDIIPVSSQNNKGIDVIRDLISQCLEQEK